ncbi:MAG: TetR/AcrR family transcriptional regulator [Acetobacteraceae bacterium]|nr:TetR/AcrR family transcriptional regulator [Acetobacteraceae bacterium]
MTRPDKLTAPSTGSAAKRERILDAARALFAESGLEGASLRAIAARAGYTAPALYFHFASKEAIYAELLRDSLARLQEAVAQGQGFRGAALALFDFYAAHPQDLALGFYLGGGGLAPRGLGGALDPLLNTALLDALAPLREAGGTARAARAFAQAVGLLVLSETKRIRLFGLPARALMEAYLDLDAPEDRP